MGTLGNMFHVNFLGYAHCFMSIRISQINDRFISLYQARYSTSVVGIYFYNATVKTSTEFYKTTLQSDLIFTKVDASISDEKFDKLTRELNIRYRSCIG